MSGLTHLDASGTAIMVDVSDKAVTDRAALAEGHVVMEPADVVERARRREAAAVRPTGAQDRALGTAEPHAVP